MLGGPSVDDGGARPGPSTGLSDGPSAPVTVGDMAGNSDMEISDDDRPPPSSVGSCLQTHPPTHPEAHDFLSSLLLEPEGEGVWPGDGTVDDPGRAPGVPDGPPPRVPPPRLTKRQKRNRTAFRLAQQLSGAHRPGERPLPVSPVDLPDPPPLDEGEVHHPDPSPALTYRQRRALKKRLRKFDRQARSFLL